MSWPRFALALAIVSLAFFLAYAHIVTEATLAAIKFSAPALKALRNLQGSGASRFAGHTIGFVVGALLSAALLVPVLSWQRGRSGQVLCMAAVMPAVLVSAIGGNLASFSGWVSAVTPLVGAMLVIYASEA
ncbi:TPA: hypothetical protein VDU83_006747 [Pseudomonas aeruginosa]|nr:hypothetical protein [Pseudomonas aeruginosa]